MYKRCQLQRHNETETLAKTPITVSTSLKKYEDSGRLEEPIITETYSDLTQALNIFMLAEFMFEIFIKP